MNINHHSPILLAFEPLIDKRKKKVTVKAYIHSVTFDPTWITFFVSFLQGSILELGKTTRFNFAQSENSLKSNFSQKEVCDNHVMSQLMSQTTENPIRGRELHIQCLPLR